MTHRLDTPLPNYYIEVTPRLLQMIYKSEYLLESLYDNNNDDVNEKTLDDIQEFVLNVRGHLVHDNKRDPIDRSELWR